MEKICFIINPKAGYQKYKHVVKLIEEKLDLSKFEYKIEFYKKKSMHVWLRYIVLAQKVKSQIRKTKKWIPRLEVTLPVEPNVLSLNSICIKF